MVKDNKQCVGDEVAKPIKISEMTIKSDSRQIAAVAWVPKDAAKNPDSSQWEV